jgi:hypothetical protein
VQPRHAAKQAAGQSGAVGTRKRERDHAEPEPARRQTEQTGRRISKHDVKWEAQLAKLKAYKRKRGDCNVPKCWAKDPPLGSWVQHQRKRKKVLDNPGRWIAAGEPSEGMPPAWVMKLEALGFTWELSAAAAISKQLRDDASWGVQIFKLKEYMLRHGDCNVPQGWAEDKRLGRWVGTQRRCKKNLDRGEPSEGMTAARVARLEALGFAWELSAAGLGKQIHKGNRDQAETRPRAPPPPCSGVLAPGTAQPADGLPLPKWRRGCDRDDAGWEPQLAKLEAYKRRHGDYNVPQGWAEDKPLGRWVMHQRAYKKKLDRGEPSNGMTAARAAKLEALGFAWELGEWEAQLAKLHVYKHRQGDCNVPQRWAEDPQLGSWVSNQRMYKKVLDRGDPSDGIRCARLPLHGFCLARVAKLDALGFAWELRGRRFCP